MGSDVEGDEPMEAVAEAVAAAVGVAPADDLGGRMDFETALREVLKSALIHDGLPVVFMKPPRLWTKDRLFCASWLRTVTRPHIRSLFKLCVKNIKFPS